MPFQIHALDPTPFAPLFAPGAVSDRPFRVMAADESPGFPCRVSLSDAALGERVVLVNHTHQPAESPYHASHAIFVREGAVQAKPTQGEVPEMLTRRTLSLRPFDAAHMMRAPAVLPGEALGDALTAVFQDPGIAYAHIHFAGPGCFAARVSRA